MPPLGRRGEGLVGATGGQPSSSQREPTRRVRKPPPREERECTLRPEAIQPNADFVQPRRRAPSVFATHSPRRFRRRSGVLTHYRDPAREPLAPIASSRGSSAASTAVTIGPSAPPTRCPGGGRLGCGVLATSRSGQRVRSLHRRPAARYVPFLAVPPKAAARRPPATRLPSALKPSVRQITFRHTSVARGLKVDTESA